MAAEGFALFRQAYLDAYQTHPLLPPLTADHEARLKWRVERAFAWGGVVAWRGDAMAGYMAATEPFGYRGLVAALVPEFGHAVARGQQAPLYGLLHAALADRLVQAGVRLHLVGHFAGDETTTAALFELGFGAIVAECVRDLSDPASTSHFDASGAEHVSPDGPWDAFAPLAAEHAAYYRQSPIFLVKDEALDVAVADLEEHRRAGDQLFVYRRGAEPVAYLVVGRCQGASEGRLLAGTTTAQIRSAFTVASARRQGIAAVLLQRAVAWAHRAGYERVFVEHETANLEGGAFWRRHFSRFVVFSMRYVEPIG